MNNSSQADSKVLKRLIEKRENLQYEISALLKRLAETNERISSLIEPYATGLRKEKPTGTVKFAIGNIIVKHKVSKTVKWDNAILEKVWHTIENHGDDPELYMKLKRMYSISEKEYKCFPEPIKKVFNPARLEELGKPSLEFRVLEV